MTSAAGLTSGRRTESPRSAGPASTADCPATADPSPNVEGTAPSSLMMRRRLTLGVCVITALVAWNATNAWTQAVALPVVAPPPPMISPGLAPPPPPAAGQRPGRPPLGGPGWRVLSHVSVLGVLVVEVETTRLHEAPGIAHHITAPTKADHVEVLVYFHRPGERFADTRVQWTPAGGYVTLRLAEPSQ